MTNKNKNSNNDSHEKLLQSLAEINEELLQIEKETKMLSADAHQELDKEKTKQILEKIINDF